MRSIGSVTIWSCDCRGIDWAIGDVEKEQQWLPKLAPFLPLAIPVPLAKGQPGEGYPWDWSIYRWLEGEEATIEGMADPRQTAIDLAQFMPPSNKSMFRARRRRAAAYPLRSETLPPRRD